MDRLKQKKILKSQKYNIHKNKSIIRKLGTNFPFRTHSDYPDYLFSTDNIIRNTESPISFLTSTFLHTTTEKNKVDQFITKLEIRNKYLPNNFMDSPSFLHHIIRNYLHHRQISYHLIQPPIQPSKIYYLVQNLSFKVYYFLNTYH